MPMHILPYCAFTNLEINLSFLFYLILQLCTHLEWQTVYCSDSSVNYASPTQCDLLAAFCPLSLHYSSFSILFIPLLRFFLHSLSRWLPSRSRSAFRTPLSLPSEVIHYVLQVIQAPCKISYILPPRIMALFRHSCL